MTIPPIEVFFEGSTLKNDTPCPTCATKQARIEELEGLLKVYGKYFHERYTDLRRQTWITINRTSLYKRFAKMADDAIDAALADKAGVPGGKEKA